MNPPSPPPGQGPVDPRGAFSPPPPPDAGGPMPMPGMPGGPTMQQLPNMPMPPMGGMGPMPGMYPPMMMPMPMSPPPREKSFARAIFTTLATSIFGLSLLANIYLLFLAGIVNSGDGPLESTVTGGDPGQKIAVIPIRGFIGSASAEEVRKWLQIIEKDQDVKGIVLDVESGGGAVTSSDEIHNEILKFKKSRQIPVAVSMRTLAASGAYYLSAPADQIFAEPTTITGSIGVIMPSYNLHELAKKWGISEDSIAAPPEGLKNAGSMFGPPNPAYKAHMQVIADQTYNRFVQIVKDGRGAKLKAEPKVFADGRIYLAEDALKYGLIDQIGYAEDAYAWVKTKANLSNPMIVKYQRRVGVMDLFAVDASKNGGTSVNVDGGKINVNVKLDPQALEELRQPRLMYLWRGE
jgi:protease-4